MRKRTFRRDAYLGVRLSEEKKDRLFILAKKKERDASNLALEFISDGLDRVEKELAIRAVGQSASINRS